ncbi:hypothetical protein SAMN05421856_102213 [Chryseobacterium taichungense]|uniref:Uncharacterized protein n=1 Tax=Chryseobacterium taichungense TaxID=295069 RepID=A0A1H7X4V1_9FLAO|nr:hypothetical protein SAMN05421856_102213 [Chryseobacterium taichungense]
MWYLVYIKNCSKIMLYDIDCEIKLITLKAFLCSVAVGRPIVSSLEILPEM